MLGSKTQKAAGMILIVCKDISDIHIEAKEDSTNEEIG